MMECPDIVNTLLHEFFLWEPDMSRKGDNTVSVCDTINTLKIKKPVDK